MNSNPQRCHATNHACQADTANSHCVLSGQGGERREARNGSSGKLENQWGGNRRLATFKVPLEIVFVRHQSSTVSAIE